MKNWQPSEEDRVCSKHFVDGQPTVDHPCPRSIWGTSTSPKTSGKSSPPSENCTEVYTIQPFRKIPKTETQQTDVKGVTSGEAELKQTVDNLNKSIKLITTTAMCAIVLRIVFAQMR